MKDLFLQGHRVLTTDRVADGILRYARTLASFGRNDVVEFPVIQDGSLSQCALLIGAHTPVLASVTVPQSYPDALEGAADAADEIDARERALDAG